MAINIAIAPHAIKVKNIKKAVCLPNFFQELSFGWAGIKVCFNSMYCLFSQFPVDFSMYMILFLVHDVKLEQLF